MTGYRTLARNHDFTVLWVGTTISELGTRVSMIAFPLVAYALTGSTGWSAATEACFLLGVVAALLPAGALADRMDRRTMMRASSLTGLAAYASLVIAGVAGVLTVGHLVAVAVVAGLCGGAFQPAESSAVRSVVSADELPTALSQQQARQHVASLLGGPIGGALFALVRWLPFAADAASYLVEWVLLGRIRADLSPAASAPAQEATGDATTDAPTDAPTDTPRGLAGVRREITAGLRFTFRQPFLRVLLLWSPMGNLTINAFFFVALLRLIQAGFPAAEIGLVETSVGIFGILGALVAPWMIARLRTGTLMIIAAWSFVPLAIPLALWNHPLVMCGCVSLGLFVNPAGNASANSYQMAVSPPHLVGRVQAAMHFVSMISMPLAPALAGALLATVGGTDAILAMAVLTALVALIPTVSRSVRSVPRPADWSIETAHPAVGAAA
jgi:MFS family permease